MKKLLITIAVMLLTFQYNLSGIERSKSFNFKDKIVTATKRLYFPEYPGAYNPSFVKFNDGYLLTFRYIPNRSYEHWISQIGIVMLDESFEQISDVQLLDTRTYNNNTPSQAEDARIFSYKDRLYLIYNDNMDLIFPNYWERRDMYITEILYSDDRFFLAEPLQLIHETKYRQMPWQKNWNPFEWNGMLMLSYKLNPHEVICPNLETGICKSFWESKKHLTWNYGDLRGGTPAQLIDGEYLAFFHSGIVTTSTSSDHRELWHYYMGAYTFSPNPPFEITKISPAPIDTIGFYTYSSYEKRIIYPAGFVVVDQNIYLAYGKDDSEIWIATIDLNELKKSLQTVK